MKTQVLKFVSQNTLTRLAFFCLCLQTSLAFSQQKDARTIIEGYAQDYQNDVTFVKDVTFAVKVDDTFWHVKALAKTEESPAQVTVHDGKPEKPSFYFKTDLVTLNKIESGEMNAVTGAAKAFSSDFAPFDADVMEGFSPDQDFLKTLLSVYFHFWTKGVA